jgi:hypothetical protein
LAIGKPSSNEAPTKNIGPTSLYFLGKYIPSEIEAGETANK